jgi:protoporphyrin/coproporphyrin ferrochelatase
MNTTQMSQNDQNQSDQEFIQTGVLVVNLGTPDAPTTSAVRKYLKEFLSDPRVIDIPAPIRWMLLNLIILPLRSPKSAKAYQKVWREDGSPLLVYGQSLTDQLAKQLAPWPVKLAMRYGNPSITSGLDELHLAGCDRIIIFPLYPQYASSTTGSTLEAVYSQLSKKWNTPSVVVVPPYFNDQRFIDAIVTVAEPVLRDVEPEHYVFSFHGLPERHVKKSDESSDQSHCLKTKNCCETLTYANRNCYRAHCVATAQKIAATLNIPQAQYDISFQSRLGRDPWLQPYTDQTIEDLARQGVKRVAVFCPAFTADCLETIEEIGMEVSSEFKEAGGEDLTLVPCVNDHPAWVDAATSIIKSASGSIK